MRGRQPETWGRSASFFRSRAAKAPVLWAWLFHPEAEGPGILSQVGPLTLHLVWQLLGWQCQTDTWGGQDHQLLLQCSPLQVTHSPSPHSYCRWNGGLQTYTVLW